MQYPRELYKHAEQKLSSRRQATSEELGRRISQIQAYHPNIRKLRKQEFALGAKMGMAVVSGDADQYDSIRREIKSIRSRICESLIAAGFPADYLEAPHTCILCEDKGFIDGHSCECRKAILNRLAYAMLSNISRVDDCSFDTFDLNYYSGANRKNMAKLLEACRRYAADFSKGSANLLFMGPPGLGKTHLSLSIAREVVNKGKMVVYASAAQLIDRLVDIKFSPEMPDDYKTIVYECDLLVLDDLGTEFQTKFTKSEVYSIINTRCVGKLPTIINTNLSFSDMKVLYDQRVVSRLEGEYVDNQFSGNDIRIAKRRIKSNEKVEKANV